MKGKILVLLALGAMLFSGCTMIPVNYDKYANMDLPQFLEARMLHGSVLTPYSGKVAKKTDGSGPQRTVKRGNAIIYRAGYTTLLHNTLTAPADDLRGFCKAGKGKFVHVAKMTYGEYKSAISSGIPKVDTDKAASSNKQDSSGWTLDIEQSYATSGNRIGYKLGHEAFGVFQCQYTGSRQDWKVEILPVAFKKLYNPYAHGIKPYPMNILWISPFTGKKHF